MNKYRRRFGYYPKVVIADKIYGTRENRRYLNENGIRFSGKKLGRPPKEMDAIAREAERLRLLEQGQRNVVEGKTSLLPLKEGWQVGTTKTRYGLGEVMTKTEQTGDNLIAIAIFSLNIAIPTYSGRRLLLPLFIWGKMWLKIIIKRWVKSNNLKIKLAFS